MSNIIEGDSVKNFGEFIPNPYIEKITVEEDTDLDDGYYHFILDIEYSLLFLVGDEFDINDVADLFTENNIVTYGMFSGKLGSGGANPHTREEIISAIKNNDEGDLQILQIYDGEAFVGFLEYLETDSDLYDSQDRQILKIYCNYRPELVIPKTFTLDYYYIYLFCSTLDQETINNAVNFNKSLLSLNIGDITYEKIFSPGLVITSDEQNVYAESNGSKFGFTPLLSTDRNFYSTNTVTREMVIDKTQTLVNRFKNGEDGTLTDMVNSIEFVLQTQGQTENLIPELDKVRKSFPNKTNNNPVGNLYASLSQLLININSAFPQTDKLERLKYTTGKVVDGREVTDPELLTLLTSSSGEYFIKPLINRLATGDGVSNDGVVFFNFEEMVKKESIFFSDYVDVDKFYEVCDEYSLSGLKRALFSKMREDTFNISVSHDTDGVQAVNFTKLNYSFQEPNNLMIAYAFQHTDKISDSPVSFDYEIVTTFKDSTEELIIDLYNKFTSSCADLKEYEEQAKELFSFNPKTDNFNNFFQNAVKPYWDDKGDGYPWQIAPTVYGIIAYLTTNKFSSLENVRTYTKNVIFNISPETGNLDRLRDFLDVLDRLDGVYSSNYEFLSSGRKTTATINKFFEERIDLTTNGFFFDTTEL